MLDAVWLAKLTERGMLRPSYRRPIPGAPRLHPALADPPSHYHDLGADYHTRRIDTERRTRSHIRQLEALGYKVTLVAT